MIYIIYHRYPSYESKTTATDEKLNILTDYLSELGSHSGTQIIIEEANTFQEQYKLHDMLEDFKGKEKTVNHVSPANVTLLCWNFSSLLAAPLTVALSHLEDIQKWVRVAFYWPNGPSTDISVVSTITRDFIKCQTEEKSKALAWRIAKNGVSYGRPTIEVDVERAIKLRAEGLPYKKIAEQLNQSLSLIYSKLPKEVKRLYRNGRYLKVGRPRLKEKRKEIR